ncbi:hypothetical protein [Sphingomonas bacterium]|uniref:hypothetical protein n=1 Tax=Sphingomonas bacterium TaxID=1895847 RepID=UPI001574EFE0|nr:hypothetical protein [Sphingomonas bacterium]
MAEDDDFLAQLDAEIVEQIKSSGGGDPWALYLIRALWPYPSGAERQDTLKGIEAQCAKVGRKLRPTFEQTVQRTFNNHNSDRCGHAPKHPLFHCVGGIGSGVWALHHDNAKVWMAKNGYELA